MGTNQVFPKLIRFLLNIHLKGLHQVGSFVSNLRIKPSYQTFASNLRIKPSELIFDPSRASFAQGLYVVQTLDKGKGRDFITKLVCNLGETCISLSEGHLILLFKKKC